VIIAAVRTAKVPWYVTWRLNGIVPTSAFIIFVEFNQIMPLPPTTGLECTPRSKEIEYPQISQRMVTRHVIEKLCITVANTFGACDRPP
jgi:hypothetical protein